MQEQNGVPIAGHFPDIPFPACCNVVGRNPLQFDVADEVWLLGAAGTQVLFNGGLTSAQVDWQSVADYRQTVLTAFQ